MNEKLAKSLLKPLKEYIPIGAIGDLSSYKLISGLKNCDNFFTKETSNELDSFRKIYSDGNSFYRAVMFSLLHILNKNVIEIKRFALDFNKIIDKQLNGRNLKINKNEFLAIIYIIIELIEKDFLEQAYAYFLKSYFVYDCFDLVRLNI
jgi:hypothetical protein